jgi:hypothetical protein
MEQISIDMLTLLEKQRVARLEVICKVSHELFVELCDEHTKEINDLINKKDSPVD